MITQNQQLSKPQFPILSIPLVIMSFLMLMIGLFVYRLADIRNNWDFMLPIAVIVQFLFALMILFGRTIGLIGLIGYALFIIALAIATIIYYISQPLTALFTLPVLAIPAIPLGLIWRKNRNYFLR